MATTTGSRAVTPSALKPAQSPVTAAAVRKRVSIADAPELHEIPNDKPSRDPTGGGPFACLRCADGDDDSDLGFDDESIRAMETALIMDALESGESFGAPEPSRKPSVLLLRQKTVELKKVAADPNPKTPALPPMLKPAATRKAFQSMMSVHIVGLSGSVKPEAPVAQTKTINERYPETHAGMNTALALLKTSLEDQKITFAEKSFWTDSQLKRILEFSATPKGFYQTAALEAVENLLAFRDEFKPMTITRKEVEKDLARGIIFFHKHNKDGVPCAVVKANLHNLKGPTDGILAAVVYCCEWAVKHVLSDDKCDCVDCIIDLQGVNFMKANFAGLDTLMSALQMGYPCRPRSIYLVNPPRSLKLVWRLVKQMLNKSLYQRITLVSNPKKTLPKYYDRDCLLPEYGGTSNFEFVWDGNLGRGLGMELVKGHTQMMQREFAETKANKSKIAQKKTQASE